MTPRCERSREYLIKGMENTSEWELAWLSRPSIFSLARTLNSTSGAKKCRLLSAVEYAGSPNLFGFQRYSANSALDIREIIQ